MTIEVKNNDAKEITKIFVDFGYFYLGFRKVDEEHIKLIFRDPIVPAGNSITDIQFHKGDYVENNDGKIGYVSSICHCDECKKRGFFEPTITYLDGTTDYISNHSVKTVSSDYKQIGFQKFSTENNVLKDRISALEKENKELKERLDNLTIQRNHAVDLLCFYERKDINE